MTLVSSKASQDVEFQSLQYFLKGYSVFIRENDELQCRRIACLELEATRIGFCFHVITEKMWSFQWGDMQAGQVLLIGFQKYRDMAMLHKEVQTLFCQPISNNIFIYVNIHIFPFSLCSAVNAAISICNFGEFHFLGLL